MTTIFQRATSALHLFTHPDARNPDAKKDHARAAELKAKLDQLCWHGQPQSSSSSRAMLHKTGPNTLVMATPSKKDAAAFAQDCVTHDIRRVVDLRSALEKRGQEGLLDGNRSVAQGGHHHHAVFEHLGTQAPMPGVGSKPGSNDAHVRQVELRLTRGETGPGVDGEASPKQRQRLALIHMPVGDGQTVSVNRLLEASVHLARMDGARDGATVFQCKDGEHVAATFAAASGLLHSFAQGRIEANKVDQAVLVQCQQVRNGHRANVFRVEDIASLTKFVHAVFEADRRGELDGIGSRRVTLAPGAGVRYVLKKDQMKSDKDGRLAKAERLPMGESGWVSRFTDSQTDSQDKSSKR